MLFHIVSKVFNILSRIDSINSDDCDNDGNDSFFRCIYTDRIDLNQILAYFTTSNSDQYTIAVYTIDMITLSLCILSIEAPIH